MDINKMLAELREEREQIEEAILTLERLAGARGHRRGRPPSWLKKVADSPLNIGQGQASHGVRMRVSRGAAASREEAKSRLRSRSMLDRTRVKA